MATRVTQRAGSVVVSTAHWPIVLCVLPASMTRAAIDDMNAKMDELFAREQTFTLVTDARPVLTLPSATDRRALSAWWSEPVQLDKLKRWSAGSSVIISNPLARGALQAIYWLWTPPNPQHAAPDLESALTFCLRCLSERGVSHDQTLTTLTETFTREIDAIRDASRP